MITPEQLHEALVVQGCAKETEPFCVCSADYRRQLVLALRSCEQDRDIDKDELLDEIDSCELDIDGCISDLRNRIEQAFKSKK